MIGIVKFIAYCAKKWIMVGSNLERLDGDFGEFKEEAKDFRTEIKRDIRTVHARLDQIIFHFGIRGGANGADQEVRPSVEEDSGGDTNSD